MRAERRRLIGEAAIVAELAELDEAVLGRRRFASEERRYGRLLAELNALPADNTQEM